MVRGHLLVTYHNDPLPHLPVKTNFRKSFFSPRLGTEVVLPQTQTVQGVVKAPLKSSSFVGTDWWIYWDLVQGKHAKIPFNSVDGSWIDCFHTAGHWVHWQKQFCTLYFEALKATRIIGLDMQSKYKVSVGDMWDTFHLLHSGRQYGARLLLSPFSNSMHHWRNRVSFCYVI